MQVRKIPKAELVIHGHNHLQSTTYVQNYKFNNYNYYNNDVKYKYIIITYKI